MGKEYMLRVRMTEADVATLDARRGELSRSEYVRQAIGNPLYRVDELGVVSIVATGVGIEPLKMPEVPVELLATVDPGDVVDALIESAVPEFVVPAKFQNRICKEHHFMGCYHCSKRAVEQGGAY